MAGESPDKTEQRKSSSGTAAEERDPRFAVFRDPGTAQDEAETADAGSETGSGTGSGATSDTATAVFRPRLPEDGARREPKPGTEAGPAAATGPEAEAASEPESEAASEPEPTAEPEAVTEPESAPEAASPASRASGASTAAGAAGEPSEGREAVQGGTGPDEDAEQPHAEASEASDGKTPAAGSADEAGADAADVDADGDGDGRLRAAVAAWVDADADPEDGPAPDAADAGAQPVTDGKDAARTTPTAESDEDAPSAAESGTASSPAPDDAEPAPDAEPKADPKNKQDEQNKQNKQDEHADKPESGAKKPASEPDADGEPKAGTAPDGAPAAGKGSGDASDLGGIDQPTAVFQAVKPGRTTWGIDQATTALKLPRDTKPGARSDIEPRVAPEAGPGTEPAAKTAAGSGTKDAAEPGTKGDAGSGGAPESDAERTSTFVPLRSDDVRAAPGKPEAGAGSAAGPEAPARTPEAAASAPAAPSWAAAERTRQQPLPPRPPLDLLAELTNTPPPPETPVRTAVRRVKIWTPLVLLLLIVFAIVQVMRPLPEPSLELTAKPTYTFEGEETKLSWPGQGQSAVMVDGVGSLGTEGAQKPAPIASVAKVMTAHVILQEHPLKGDEEGEKITVDQKAEDESKRPDESTAPLTKGQKLSQRQMLQLLMIPSGNNAARLLARWDAGSEDAFIDKMNDAAEDLGMTNSTYTDPSGLEKTTVSTATDQLKLAQAVMRNEVFRKIVDMPEVEIEGIDGKIYNNNNLLLQPGVSGIKTGSSTPAGGNLLWSANTKVDGKLLWIYGAVMGQQAGTGRVYDSLELSLQNSLKLIKDAQEAPTSATVVKKGDVVGYVDNGFGGKTAVIATKNLKAVGWSGLKVELQVTAGGEGIAHEAKAGSEVGMVTVGTGTGKVTAPVVLQDDLTQPAFGDKLTRIG
ncbi:serine hydrolase [Streptomyces sp. NPDC017448]|uniref:D-alanyl-D-alanine carboxypeptidase n=1 Tax=Streptomyces sp. NPDC017448 TaxID=3364996 RepID=UPI00379FFF76